MARRILISMLTLFAIAAFASLGSAQEEAPATGPRVDQAVICTGVEDRQPVGADTRFPAGVERLYCWTRLADLDGKTVVHAWIHEGVTRARVELRVGSPMWRTYSSKQIRPEWTGKWEVKVMTQEGRVLSTLGFEVGSAAP